MRHLAYLVTDKWLLVCSKTCARLWVCFQMEPNLFLIAIKWKLSKEIRKYKANLLSQVFVAFLPQGCNLASGSASPLLLEETWAFYTQSKVWYRPSSTRLYIIEKVPSGILRESKVQSGVHTSPIGLIPKPNQTTQYSLILDLSSPHNHIISDGVYIWISAPSIILSSWILLDSHKPVGLEHSW